MTHPLFVGHFDVNVCSFRPKVIKQIDLGKVTRILANHCDKEQDGSLVIAKLADLSLDEDGWLGRIGSEDVHFKSGYLICPWLGTSVNRPATSFVSEVHDALGAQIFEPGDCVFLSPEQLALAEREFYGRR